jgi:hypothetical protein
MEKHQDRSFLLECWKMIYNVCMDENQKQSFIMTKGIEAMKKSISIFHLDLDIVSEICDFCSLLSIGKDARYRFYTLYTYGIIYLVLSILTQFRDDKNIVEKALSAMRYLVLNYSSEKVAVENGAQELVCDIILRHPSVLKKGVTVLQNLFSIESSHSTSIPIAEIVMKLFRYASQKEEIDQLILFIGNLSSWHRCPDVDSGAIKFSINDFISSPIASRFVECEEFNWIPIPNEKLEKMYQDFKHLYDISKTEPFCPKSAEPMKEPEKEEKEEKNITNPHKTTRRSFIYYQGSDGKMVRIP